MFKLFVQYCVCMYVVLSCVVRIVVITISIKSCYVHTPDPAWLYEYIGGATTHTIPMLL